MECGASFLSLYLKALSSISMFYKSKLAFCNFIQLEKWSVERGPYFMLLYPNQGVRVGESEWRRPSRGARIWESETGRPNLGIQIEEPESGNLDQGARIKEFY